MGIFTSRGEDVTWKKMLYVNHANTNVLKSRNVQTHLIYYYPHQTLNKVLVKPKHETRLLIFLFCMLGPRIRVRLLYFFFLGKFICIPFLGTDRPNTKELWSCVRIGYNLFNDIALLAFMIFSLCSFYSTSIPCFSRFPEEYNLSMILVLNTLSCFLFIIN